MPKFAHVPVVPGPVKEVFVGDKLFDMHREFAETWYKAPDNVDEHYHFDGKKFMPPVDNSAAHAWHKLQIQAHSALHKNDQLAIRCMKKGIEFPAEWQKYDEALQTIVEKTEIDTTLALPQPPRNSDGSVKYPF